MVNNEDKDLKEGGFARKLSWFSMTGIWGYPYNTGLN